jgi:hypothetical protein
MAKPVRYSASGSVLVEASWGRPATVDCGRPSVRDHRAPVYVPPAPVKPAPIVVWNPTNTRLGGDSSVYIGSKPFMLDRIHGGAQWRPSGWVQMTEPTRIDNGREFFTFGAEAGMFSQIQLLETHGTSFIQQVVIEYVGGGRVQKHELGGITLTKGQAISIDLAGHYRQINRIVVYGSTARGSAYQILGR